MKLTDKACRNAKGDEKPYKMPDGGGLYLLVQPDGAKYWRLKYRYLGKEKLLALGVYPLISLAEAREKRDTAKKQIAAGQDPAQTKKTDRRMAIRKANNTFAHVASEWHEKQLNIWTPKHGENVMRKLDMDVFPYIGSRPIGQR